MALPYHHTSFCWVLAGFLQAGRYSISHGILQHVETFVANMPTIQWCSKWSLPFSASCNCWRFSSVSHRSSQAPTMPRRDWDRTFMIRMKHQVQTHRLLEPFALIHPQHPKPDDGRLLWMSGWCPGILRQRSKIYQIKNPDRIKKIYDVSICVNTCDPTENLGAIGAIGWFSSRAKLAAQSNLVS